MVRRRPLLRAAAIGGTYAAGRAAGRRAQEPTGGYQAPGPQDTSAEAGTPVLDQLTRLTAMHDQGALSDEEFATAKAKVLGDR